MSLLASSAQGKGGPDAILAYSAAAAARAAEIGKENIINATTGAFLNADGSLKTMDHVRKAMEQVSFDIGANYAPMEGTRPYIDAMLDNVLREYRPAGTFTDGVATPGGTGAIHNAFINYLEEGDTCVTTNYCWGNYRKMLHEMGRKFDTFNTFTPDGDFDVDACLTAVNGLCDQQKNVMLLLNTPAHNPTGLALTDSEWHQVIDALKDIANNGKNNVILVVDTAYIDYAPLEARKFFEFFSDLPENFLVVVCASASKGYTLYGYRLGLEFCIAQTAEVCDEFMDAAKASARATWSSCSHPAMDAIASLAADPETLASFRAEQAEFAESLSRRAAIFTAEAAECELPIFRYRSGFFIYVPTADHDTAVRIYDILTRDEIYVVPLGNGLRIAICAIDDEQLKGMAAKVKAAYDEATK